MFEERKSVKEVEEGEKLSPKFDKSGLIPAVTTDCNSGELLMHAYMNKEALEKSIKTKEAHYFSRSRNCVWHKGATSGFTQKIVSILIDDDQDCIWLKVEVEGGASCHVGYKSCFYREIKHSDQKTILKFTEKNKVFDPEDVYGDAPNPTIL